MNNINCPDCKKEIPVNSEFCGYCGNRIGYKIASSNSKTTVPNANIEKPPNYLIPAILATLFCFPITGIVAIIYASQSNTKWIAGDIQGALFASQRTKVWLIISLMVGLSFLIVSVINF